MGQGEVRFRRWLRTEIRKALREAMVAPPPGQRPAPHEVDRHRGNGESWHDGRYETPWSAKNKDGHIRRYATQDRALNHARSNTEKKMPGETDA